MSEKKYRLTILTTRDLDEQEWEDYKARDPFTGALNYEELEKTGRASTLYRIRADEIVESTYKLDLLKSKEER